MIASTAHERLIAALAAPMLPITSSRTVSAHRRCSTATGWATTASGFRSGAATNRAGVGSGAGGLGGGSSGGRGGAGIGLTDTLGGDSGGSRAGDGSGAGSGVGCGAGSEDRGVGAGSGMGGTGTGNRSEGAGAGAGRGNRNGRGASGSGTAGPSNGRAGAGNSRPPRGGAGTVGRPNGGTTGCSNAPLGVAVSGRSDRSPCPGSRGSTNGRRVPSGSSNPGTDRGSSPTGACPAVTRGAPCGVSTGCGEAVGEFSMRGVVRGVPTLGGPTEGSAGAGTAPTGTAGAKPTPASATTQSPLRTVFFTSAAPARRRRPSVRPQRLGRRDSVARRW